MNFLPKIFFVFSLTMMAGLNLQNVHGLAESWTEDTMKCLKTACQTFIEAVKPPPQKNSSVVPSVEGIPVPGEGENKEEFLKQMETQILVGKQGTTPLKWNGVDTKMRELCRSIDACGISFDGDLKNNIEDALYGIYVSFQSGGNPYQYLNAFQRDYISNNNRIW